MREVERILSHNLIRKKWEEYQHWQRGEKEEEQDEITNQTRKNKREYED